VVASGIPNANACEVGRHPRMAPCTVWLAVLRGYCARGLWHVVEGLCSLISDPRCEEIRLLTLVTGYTVTRLLVVAG
jgi:hypothetical protein